MMNKARQLLALVLCACLVVFAQGNAFKKVRYNGGSISSKVSPHDWDNVLTVTPDLITLKLKDGAKAESRPRPLHL